MFVRGDGGCWVLCDGRFGGDSGKQPSDFIVFILRGVFIIILVNQKLRGVFITILVNQKLSPSPLRVWLPRTLQDLEYLAN